MKYLIIRDIPKGVACLENVGCFEGLSQEEALEKAVIQWRASKKSLYSVPINELYDGWEYYL